MNKDPFKEYIKESEPAKRDKGYAWHTAIGLQAVDGLTTSEYLVHTAVRNIEGEISWVISCKLIFLARKSIIVLQEILTLSPMGSVLLNEAIINKNACENVNSLFNTKIPERNTITVVIKRKHN